MNISVLIGMVIAGLVLYFGAIGGVSKPAIFLDSHAMILVIGGTAAAAFIAYPIKKILGLVQIFISRVVLNRHVKHSDLVKEFVAAAPVAKVNPSALADRKTPHPFVSEGYGLISEGVLSESELKEVLTQRSLFFKRDYGGDAKIWLALAKFPPAFGLMGATSGMIAMMASLEENQDNIGSAMAVALVATFWGIAVANLILLPLSDYFQKLVTDDQTMRQLVIEGLMMIKRRESSLVITEKLNSYLTLKERISDGSGGASQRRAA